MNIFRLLQILFSVTFLCACTSGDDRNSLGSQVTREATDSLEALQEEPDRKGKLPNTDTLRFEKAFDRFFNALQTADTTTLNEYIHPSSGVWIIEQPGAVPKMTRVTDITSFKREYQDRSFFTVREEVKECDLRSEAWPTFDCADLNYDARRSGYSKDGCFVTGATKFQKSGYWNYASLSDEQIKQVNATLPLVQRSVLHTPTSFEFHFGYVDGHWRLLFTKLIYPCSA